MPAQHKHITILGAGVTALTAAYVLRSAGYSVHIFARDLPEDTSSQAFASPWAGANWCTFAKTANEQRRDELTFRKWLELNKQLPEETMTLMNFEQYFDEPTDCWFKRVVPDFKEIAPIPGSGYGTSYTSFTISVPNYMKWLVSELTSPSPSILRPRGSGALGEPVTFTRTSTIESLSAAAALWPSSTLVVNATGLGSHDLSDVRDSAVHPIRGQTLLVSVPPFKGAGSIARCVMKPGAPTCYVIPRARSGYVILGGSFEVGSSKMSADEELSDRILKGCVDICPQLLWKDKEGREKWSSWEDIKKHAVVGVNVGLRPAREGGARVERGGKVKGRQGSELDVVHAYGIAASGYQASFGIAEEVLELVKQCDREKGARL